MEQEIMNSFDWYISGECGSPIEPAGSVTKSLVCFRHARWKLRKQYPRFGYRLLYHLNRSMQKHGEFTGRYIEEFKFT
ncbi:MAG: hypothetical protein WA364_17875, partial [Candidatus Nitrosopolaris sp.]